MLFRILDEVRLSELISLEARIYVPELLTVDSRTIVEFKEIVLQFLAEPVTWQHVLHGRLFTISLVGLIRRIESNELRTLELEICILNEVVEHVSLIHHLQRTVVLIVRLAKTLEDLRTVICDGSKLSSDPVHEFAILYRRDLVTRGRNIDQTSDDTRLSICDLYRLVGSHVQK